MRRTVAIGPHDSEQPRPQDNNNQPEEITPRPFLVSSTRSPLASPKTPVHRLAAALQSCLYFPDPGPLYAVCGSLAANTMRGYPVWLMLIGPPESGKTELLKPLLAIHGVRECGDLSGKAALLSGTKLKDKAADATGGLLKDMPVGVDGVHRGALIMLDFARTVLAGDTATTRSTLGSIGMLHDQQWQRDIGTDGGRTISFRGRIGFLAACTDVIDHPDNFAANSEMGERCIYYRYPESDGYHEISSALDNPDGTAKSSEIQELFTTWANETELDWDDLAPPRALDDQEKKLISSLAQFAAKGRSGVQRNKFNRNEISGVSRSALGPRLANTLAQLLRGMERCGCTSTEISDVLRHVAMDSLPAIRAMAVRSLLDGPKGLSEVSTCLRVSSTAAKQTLEDLGMHQITEDLSGGCGNRWALTDMAAGLLKSSQIDS